MADKSVSEWLSALDTHAIFEAGYLAKAFTKETGESPCWVPIPYKSMLRMIDDRGAGNLQGEPGEDFADTFHVALACYHKYADGKGAGDFYGRGTQVESWITAIKEIGK